MNEETKDNLIDWAFSVSKNSTDRHLLKLANIIRIEFNISCPHEKVYVNHICMICGKLLI